MLAELIGVSGGFACLFGFNSQCLLLGNGFRFRFLSFGFLTGCFFGGLLCFRLGGLGLRSSRFGLGGRMSECETRAGGFWLGLDFALALSSVPGVGFGRARRPTAWAAAPLVRVFGFGCALALPLALVWKGTGFRGFGPGLVLAGLTFVSASASPERMTALGGSGAGLRLGVTRALEARILAFLEGFFDFWGMPRSRLQRRRLTLSVTEIQCTNA